MFWWFDKKKRETVHDLSIARDLISDEKIHDFMVFSPFEAYCNGRYKRDCTKCPVMNQCDFMFLLKEGIKKELLPSDIVAVNITILIDEVKHLR